MAITATALEPDDWQDEDELAAVVPFAPPQAANRSWVLAPSTEEIAELKKQIAVKNTAARMLNERVRKLIAESAAKDTRIAELETQHLAAQEDLTHRENENRSLQTSLDLSVVEGARLSGQLWDSGVEAEAQRLRFDTLKAALLASEGERGRLTAAMQEASDLHRIELETLTSRLEGMTVQAVVAESKLADVRKSLALRTEESDVAGRKAAQALRERDAAAATLRELSDRLQAKEKQVRELESSRSKLIVQAASLLEAFEARAAALAETEAKANTLARQFKEADAHAALLRSQVEGLTAKLETREAALAEAAKALQSLTKRAAEAESQSRRAQSEAEGLVVRMRNHEGALAEAADSIQLLAERATEADVKARTAHGETQSLNAKLQDLGVTIQNQQSALTEAATANEALTACAAEAATKSRAAESKLEAVSLELQHEQAHRAIAEVAVAKVQTESARLRRQLERLATRNRELEEIESRRREAIEAKASDQAPAEPAQPAAAPTAQAPVAETPFVQSLLAATISL
jgi:chromosome segregation ATPase